MAVSTTVDSNSTSSGGNCKITVYRDKCEMYNYVKFWRNQLRPKDCYESPLRVHNPTNETEKFLLFEPDNGGWNNIRMAAETAIIFAHATGRTLVMPPVAKWYLLNRNKKDEDNHSTFNKFFDISKLEETIKIISMEDYIDNVARKGLLKVPFPAEFAQMPTNEFLSPGAKRVWHYLEQSSYVREWEPGKIFIGFNFEKGPDNQIIYRPFEAYNNRNFTNLNNQRLKRFSSHGRLVLPYDEFLHSQQSIYFPGDYRNTHRILTHFYTYLYFEDHHLEHIYKRLVRDRLHYHDDIFCAAGRAVAVLHKLSASINNIPPQETSNQDPITLGGNTNIGPTYFAYHIRRGDFQYKHTKLSAEQIYNNTKHLFPPGVTRLLYISTDETQKSFFNVFREHFHVVFLHDILDNARLGDAHLNQNHIGMVEQVICANAHTFVGTPLSTFTGYITRMRGYYRDQRYKRTFYTMRDQMYSLHHQEEIKGPFWAREFSVSHKEIDDDSKAIDG